MTTANLSQVHYQWQFCRSEPTGEEGLSQEESIKKDTLSQVGMWTGTRHEIWLIYDKEG